jgi:hypothetical protein
VTGQPVIAKSGAAILNQSSIEGAAASLVHALMGIASSLRPPQ